jgi:pyruvate dehydrogenase E2 component (dihydrolipoamide acetyltransferase)
MSFLYRMPSLGAEMEAGTLLEWFKKPGDAISRGEVVAVVETQKGAIDVEVFHDGVIGKLLVAPGTRVPVGTPLAELEGVELTRGVEIEPAPTQTAAAPRRIPTPPSAPPTVTVPRHRASPAARRLADTLGVSLAGLSGRGPGGAVLLADVEVASTRPGQSAQSTAPRRGLDLAAMREAIAAAMCRSKREIPHFYLSHEVDLERTREWLARRNAERRPEHRLLLGVTFLKAVAVALGKYPEFNGFDRNGQFEPGPGIHIGSATAIRGGGLVAPAIHDVDGLALNELMTKLRDLVARVRAGSLRSSELADPTITVSSLGERGVDRLYGVIYPPQVAIVGFGTPSVRPRVVGQSVATRFAVTITLAADHRHSDGHRGALFLARIGQLLQEPERL